MGLPKRKLVFQLSIFRCYVSFRGCSWGIITASSLQDSNERSSTVFSAAWDWMIGDWIRENWLLDEARLDEIPQRGRQTVAKVCQKEVAKLVPNCPAVQSCCMLRPVGLKACVPGTVLLLRCSGCMALGSLLLFNLRDGSDLPPGLDFVRNWTWRSPKSGFWWDRRSLTIWQFKKKTMGHTQATKKTCWCTPQSGVKFHPSATYLFSAIYSGFTHNFRIYNDHLNHLWALSCRLTGVWHAKINTASPDDHIFTRSQMVRLQRVAIKVGMVVHQAVEI